MFDEELERLMTSVNKLEPVDDLICDRRNPPNEAVQMSIAISLKRIADNLDRVTSKPTGGAHAIRTR